MPRPVGLDCPPSARLQAASALLHAAAAAAALFSLGVPGLLLVGPLGWNAWRARQVLAEPVAVCCEGPGRWRVRQGSVLSPPAPLGTGTWILGPFCRLRMITESGSRSWLVDLGGVSEADRRRLRAAVGWMP